MTEEIKQIGGGLLPLKKDTRDFKLGSVFSAIDISEVPDTDFIISSPLFIKNQYNSDFCVAFAGAAVSEDQELVELSPEWLFAKAKDLLDDWKSWGLDLRTMAKVLTKFGALRKEFEPEYNLHNYDRDFLANYENWDEALEKNASLHKKKSYFFVDNLGKDTFDSFRIALWQHKEEKCSILTGTIWEKEWTNAPGGIIPKEKGIELFGHALKIFGQKNINDELYLVAQLSNGTEIGLRGIFFFPREVINRCFTFGAYCFIDLDPNEVKKEVWSFQRQLWEKIKNLLKRYFKL